MQPGAALPAHAMPRFLRITAAPATTSTFKLRKVEFKQQGDDPATVHDPLYVLLDRHRGYEPLTAAIHRRILSGAAKSDGRTVWPIRPSWPTAARASVPRPCQREAPSIRPRDARRAGSFVGTQQAAMRGVHRPGRPAGPVLASI